MPIWNFAQKFDWKKVKNSTFKKPICCPRCNNSVDYYLAWDGDSLGWGKLSLTVSKKVYAYKCPICPNYELISNELAKAILGDKTL